MANYGYLNARVRALRTRLLPPGFVDQVLAGGGFEAFTSALAQTAYAPDLESAQAYGAAGERASLSGVDRAIAANVARTARALLGYAEGDAETLLGLLLRRYDVANLKAVARAFHAGKAGAEREDAVEAVLGATLPIGELDAATVRTMAGASDLAGAAQALVVAGHPLAPAFRAAVAAYVKGGDFFALELALDQAHHASVFEEARSAGADEAFLAYLALEVDATNLQTAVKLRGRDLDVDACFVPGGDAVTRKQFAEIAAAAPGAALPSLRRPFADAPDDPAALEPWLRAAVERTARTLTADPLGIGLVTHYLRAKEREAASLRLLARGTFYGVPAETLRRELGHA
ncbi:MAG: V-type ATP synthase subunit C [Trueperaceae bacterium]|nr:MAG: V-type ATP synthase subunit C [Trueperaceae bacterium]